MDRNFFIAMSLCAGIYLVWNNHFTKPIANQTVQTQQVTQGQTEEVAKESNAPISKAEISSNLKNAVTPKTIQLGTEQNGIKINSIGGVIDEIKLKPFNGKDSSMVSKVIGEHGQLSISTSSKDWKYLENINYTVVPQAQPNSNLANLKYEDENVLIDRKYSYKPEQFVVDHDLKIKFKKQTPEHIFLGIKANSDSKNLENEKRSIDYSKKTGGITKYDFKDFVDTKEDIQEGQWAGFSSRYFLNAIAHNGADGFPQFSGKSIGDGIVQIDLVYKTSGSEISIPSKLYYGPKDLAYLKAAGHTLDLAVDFGWFTFLAYPMLWFLKWFYGFVKNYGLSIIILTVLVKIVTYPLTYKSMKGMKQMQKFQPQMAKLREKYADDKERMNRETMQLMKSSGYNPMSGCFPILIQMPVFISLYNVLYGAVDLYNQPFFGWIHDLSTKDPFYIMPISLSLVMYLQQKMTPQSPGMDPAQQKMMQFMPLIFGFMMMGLPAGLTLYMLVNSVVSIFQTLIINKSLDASTSPVVV